ncbi:hypothetical protein PMIN06_009468 [Paraphaeosphaeria minitans]
MFVGSLVCIRKFPMEAVIGLYRQYDYDTALSEATQGTKILDLALLGVVEMRRDGYCGDLIRVARSITVSIYAWRMQLAVSDGAGGTSLSTGLRRAGLIVEV